MPSFTKTIAVLAGLFAAVSAAPPFPRLTRGQMRYYEHSKRQNAAAAAAGLTDVDILQLYVFSSILLLFSATS